MKVLTIVGTRPEIIRLSALIPKLDQFTDHRVVHTGQNFDYELNQVFYDDLDLRSPDVYLNASGTTPIETISKCLVGVDAELERFCPDAVLILGDTNSGLSALAAKRRAIPIFHMEAGNRCFDDRVPEEINRRVIDHFSDVNLPYSGIAREYLLREGLRPELVIKTGSPLREVINKTLPKTELSDVLERLALSSGQYFLVSVHRAENVDPEDKLRAFCRLLNSLVDRFQIPVIVTAHPRTRKRLSLAEIELSPEVRLCKPFSFSDYLALQINSRTVLSDSGSVTEEASILNLPAINLRDVNERPEGFEDSVAMMLGFEIDKICSAISLLDDQSRQSDWLRSVADYEDVHVADKVLRIILSYTEYVKRRVWFRP